MIVQGTIERVTITDEDGVKHDVTGSIDTDVPTNDDGFDLVRDECAAAKHSITRQQARIARLAGVPARDFAEMRDAISDELEDGSE